MKVGQGKVFNLLDTNGRRNDVISALSGYVEILDDLKREVGGRWQKMPASKIQYEFYKRAIARSPEVFRQHVPYDALQDALDHSGTFRKALERNDMEWIAKHREEYTGILSAFDKGIEDRARHFTSTLSSSGSLTKDAIFPLWGNYFCTPTGYLGMSWKRRFPLMRSTSSIYASFSN